MKTKTTKILFLSFLVTFFVAVACLLGLSYQPANTASAATIESYDNLDFKSVTNADGSQSYSVSLKVAYRKTAEHVVVPNTYNGFPVTEIAASGFMSCTKLIKVTLPKSVVTIGKNAFMNCTSLEHIAMPGVETIGDNAFAMCTKLERLYFPLSVKSVGSTILRNNSNTIYLQGSQDEIDKLWSSTWNSYFTGKTVEKVEPSDLIRYREILAEDNQTVVGYEIQEYQDISGGDIVIYNMIKTEDNPKYLPVLNICSEAFTYSVGDSLTIKDRHEEDPSAPVPTHKINIRSNAFLLAIIDEINIEVGVTFDHPKDLQGEQISIVDDVPIAGDANGHSTRVFEDSSVQTVTLPADLEIITETMFKNCIYLESIKINGADYDGTNVLPNVSFIGTRAFEYCISLDNLTVPGSVTYFGHNVFDGWGVNIDHQELNLDFYEGFVPGESDWSATGEDGKDIADLDTVHVKYKEPTTIHIDLQDGSGKQIAIQVKPGLEMPELPELTRRGYEFNGIFGSENGKGYQYYTDSREVARLWQEGDSDTLYVRWDIIEYSIEYDYDEVPFEVARPYNPTKYTVEDGEIFFNVPYMEGYHFWWDPASIPQDYLGDIHAVLHCRLIEYSIKYIMNDGTNTDANPQRIDITQTVVLQDPVRNGYMFIGWKLDGAYVTTLQNVNRDIVLEAIWEPTLTPSDKTTRVNTQRVWIDLTDAPYISGCTLIVESSVQELIIFANDNIVYYMSVIVANRDTDISIKLINVCLRGAGYCDTITVESEVTLHLYAVNSAVYGHEGYQGVRGENGVSPSFVGHDGGAGEQGYVAIRCHRLVIHDSVTICGGTGGQGGAGGSGKYPGQGGAGGAGGYAVDAKVIVVMADGVKLVGGAGGRGGSGALDDTCTKSSEGGLGGLGSQATNAEIIGFYTPELVAGQQGERGKKGSLTPVN